MGAVTIRTNSQTATLTAVYDFTKAEAASCYSDAAFASPISLPHSIADGEVVYLRNGDKRVTVVVTNGGTYAERVLVQAQRQIVDIPIDNLGALASSGGEPLITAGTTAQYWRGDKSWQTLDATAVALGNVNNTPDASKPVSTATQTALNAKVAASGQTGTVDLTGATTNLGVTRIKDSADATKVVALDASGVTTGTTRTLTVPNASGTLVLTNNAGSLTNKTLDSSNSVDPAAIAGLTASLADGGRTFRPGDQGLVAWAFDPIGAASNGAASNGIPYLVRLQVPATVSVTKFIWTVGSAGSGPVAGQNWVGIYDAAGTLLVSAGVDSDISSTGLKTTTLASTSLSAGWVWAAMLFNASSPPSPLKFNNGSSIALANANLAAGSYRFATNGSSRTTFASTITTSSNASSTSSYWVALAV